MVYYKKYYRWPPKGVGNATTDSVKLTRVIYMKLYIYVIWSWTRRIPKARFTRKVSVTCRESLLTLAYDSLYRKDEKRAKPLKTVSKDIYSIICKREYTLLQLESFEMRSTFINASEKCDSTHFFFILDFQIVAAIPYLCTIWYSWFICLLFYIISNTIII